MTDGIGKQILFHEGIEGLAKAADENSEMHPSLYLTAMAEYEKSHDYIRIEKIGERALEKIDSGLMIRSKAALKAAYASSCLMHQENMMLFCWEAFRSDSTARNLLRLFGTEEMAKRYGLKRRLPQRAHYGDVAALLAMVAQIKESMGVNGAEVEIFAMYKKKFPRHSSFQAEMKHYFGERRYRKNS